jgi:hypothetical protein
MLAAENARGEPAQTVEPDHDGADREIGARHEIDRQAARMREQRDFRRAAQQRQHGHVFGHVERHACLLQFGDARFGVVRFVGRDERRERAAQAFHAGAIARDRIAEIGIGRHIDEEPQAQPAQQFAMSAYMPVCNAAGTRRRAHRCAI